MIRVDRSADIWTVSLDRPEKANALTLEMLTRLADLAQDAAQARLKLFVLTGSGRVFSAGADLSQISAGLATDPIWDTLSNRVAALPCVTIAALNGTLAGGAFGMALACDFRVAVPEAEFFYPVMKMGVSPPPEDARRLLALVGPARARSLLLAGERPGSAQALDWGLIDRIAPSGDALGAAMSLGASALSATPEHVATIKAALR